MDPLTIENRLVKRPLPDLLPAGEGWIMPSYDGLSIANLPATIASLLGASLPGALPALPGELWSSWGTGLKRVVLVVLDALGYRMLQAMWAAAQGQSLARLAQAGVSIPLTSVFPSTTDAALTTLSTGRPPAEHGWLAYEIYLREFGMATNAILLSPVWARQPDLLLDWGLEPHELVTVPTLQQQLTAVGVETHAVLSSFFMRSGFTSMLYRGVASMTGHHHASDLWVHVRRALAETRGKRAFITAYWSGLDTIGHAYGHDSDPWRAEFGTVDYLLGREFLDALPAADRDGTLLLITADHGQIRIPSDGIVTADQDPGLAPHLMVPVMGESRAAFLYPRPGRKQLVTDHLRDEYPGWFAVVSSGDALEAGLMGQPVCDESYARAGELLVIPRRDHALQRSHPKVTLVSRHGGLTPEEMLVPLIASRLETVA